MLSDNFHKLFPNNYNLEKHMMPHCHPNNTLHDLNALNNGRRTHRNKMNTSQQNDKHWSTHHENRQENDQINFHTDTQQWKCNICGKCEKPQDYVNMESHIWRHSEKTRQQEITKNKTTNQKPH